MENELFLEDQHTKPTSTIRRHKKWLIGGGSVVAIAVIVLFIVFAVLSFTSIPEESHARALHLMENTPLVDSHNDLPWAYRSIVNLNVAALPIQNNLTLTYPQLQTDIPRIKAGRLGGQIWSVYVSCGMPDPVQATMEQIDVVYRMAANYPDFFKMVYKSSDIVSTFKSGKFPSLMGMEGGHSINSSMGVLRTFYTLGARYMTLTHTCSTPWAQSANDVSGTVIGLTEYGKEIVKEMNRIGMMVDISHVAVQTMYDTLNTSLAPVIFSHSNAKTLCNHIRNVPDDVLQRMPKNRGVVMVVFYPEFVCERYRVLITELQAPTSCYQNYTCMEEAIKSYQSSPLACNVSDVADQIDYIVKMAGIDHVGIGSDYDGVEVLPEGLEDVSKYPALITILIERGYGDDDIKKILSGNIIRVLKEVEDISAKLTKSNPVGPVQGN